jgi:hypothetical protein
MYDSRPNTASSIASSVGSAYGYDYSQTALQQQQQQQQASAGMLNVRRDSAPQHIPLPTQAMGFRQAQDGPTPTQQNPFPGSGGPIGGIPPALSVHTNRQQPAMSGGYPFQALNQPMPQAGFAQGYQQFAFQR